MKNSLTKTVAAAIAAGIMLLAAGCKDDGPGSKVFVKNRTDAGPRIAVIPFDSVGNVRSQDAGRVVTHTVITYLLSTGDFDVVEPGAVDEALVANQIRIGEGLRKADLEALQKALNLDGVILGLVEEYGDVRIANDTYPSISFTARLINARTGAIVWAGAISKTGADKVKIFDIGRISSPGKLCKVAVQEMAVSMARNYNSIMAAIQPPPGEIPIAQVPVDHGTTVPAPPEPTLVTAAGKSTDESKTYGESELKALLPDIAGYTKGEFEHKKHFHDTIEGRYAFSDGKQFVEAKLIDYQKVATAEKFVQMYHAGEEGARFAGLPAFIKTTDFGYEHVDVAVGRFGLFVRGPAAKKDDVEKVAAGLVAAIK